ncbi:DUF4440 domain-containing protein [Natronomonas marina]|jgi:hypothetical protein|uniref:DUF4440 domain-containing protein n=1 Tax=Natronomonas marina TaxID=2961939 RepID=UPI0020C9BD49|nr:DUF4440 domain-containing protein [Natronomonas marina]
MLTPTACRAEITGLHEFFVEWFAGAAPRSDLSRLERALAPEFEMVTTAGERVDHEALVDGIAESHGRTAGEDFDIDVREIETVALLDDHAVVRYEERQSTAAGETGRVSTALFRADEAAPEGVVWVTLQETGLES